MPTVKNVNYTDEQVQRLHAVYNPNASQAERDEAVEMLATEFGKSPRSIRSKLVNEKIFVKKASVSKVTGEEAMKKDAMAKKLRDVSGLNLNVESVAKMNKTDMQLFITHFEELFADDCAALDEVETSEDETVSENS